TGPQSIHILRGVRQQQDEPGRFSICSRQAAVVQVGQLNLTTFMNDTGLESIGENLYIETQSSGAPNESTPGLNGAGLLYQGYVETSNVNVAEELVNMIQVQRAYEINSKAVSTTDQMLQKLTQL
ncbi:flagellar hook-basal body complex protein, partial [Salmonella enterica]|uniref:flagellar hook-basal body complex protein n=1 Tax=Salmonella enterica TaxID=28901 RepID=UPI001FB01C35